MTDHEYRIAMYADGLDSLINSPKQDPIFEDYNRMLHRVVEYPEQNGRLSRFDVNMDISADLV